LSNVEFHFWAQVAKGASMALTFVIVLLLVYSVGPLIETRLFPVVGKLQILTMTDDPQGNTVVDVAFDKRRDCEYVGLAWFRGRHDSELGFMRVAVVTRAASDTSNPNRPTGRQQAGPWTIAVPPAEIASNSFAVLYHRCHPFWITRTEFYP
jgi:hypothetical protein